MRGRVRGLHKEGPEQTRSTRATDRSYVANSRVVPQLQRTTRRMLIAGLASDKGLRAHGALSYKRRRKNADATAKNVGGLAGNYFGTLRRAIGTTEFDIGVSTGAGLA